MPNRARYHHTRRILTHPRTQPCGPAMLFLAPQRCSTRLVPAVLVDFLLSLLAQQPSLNCDYSPHTGLSKFLIPPASSIPLLPHHVGPNRFLPTAVRTSAVMVVATRAVAKCLLEFVSDRRALPDGVLMETNLVARDAFVCKRVVRRHFGPKVPGRFESSSHYSHSHPV